jgi:hypothetical protein
MPKKLFFILLVLLILQACNSTQASPTEFPNMTHKTPIVLPTLVVPSPTTTGIPAESPTQVAATQTPIVEAPTVLPTLVAPSPTVTDIPTITPTQVAATQTPIVEALIDPCMLVSQSTVEAILGEPVQVNPETNGCVYPTDSGSRSMSIHVGMGEEVKLGLLNMIVQMRDGCSINSSFSSEQPTATPLPPEIQDLANHSLIELMALQDEAFQECGWLEDVYQTIDSLGDQANFMMLDLGFFKIGSVNVALDETYLVFRMVAKELDSAVALEACLTLAQEALESLR